ncbi:hypothetical protein ACFLWR_05020 [Chloroflexota bacterium]
MKSILTPMIIVVMLFISGCDAKYYKGIKSFEEDSGEGYKTITVITDYYGFSLEYPTFYEKKRPRNIYPEWTIPNTLVSFRAPKANHEVMVVSGDRFKTVTSEYIPAHIAVQLYDPTANSSIKARPASEILNDRLEGQARWENYKLIERSPIIVSGVEGEYVEWEVDWVTLFANKSNEPRLEYKWQVLFDHKGMRWEISALSSGSDLKDRIEADFHHVVKTFKILD